MVNFDQIFKYLTTVYRAPGKNMYFLLIRTQAGPGSTVKQEQEEISLNHGNHKHFPGALYPGSVYRLHRSLAIFRQFFELALAVCRGTRVVIYLGLGWLT